MDEPKGGVCGGGRGASAAAGTSGSSCSRAPARCRAIVRRGAGPTASPTGPNPLPGEAAESRPPRLPQVGGGGEARTDLRERGRPRRGGRRAPGVTSSAHDATGWGITRRPHDVMAPASVLSPPALLPLALWGSLGGDSRGDNGRVKVEKDCLSPWSGGPLQVTRHHRIS